MPRWRERHSALLLLSSQLLVALAAEGAEAVGEADGSRGPWGEDRVVLLMFRGRRRFWEA